MRRHDLRTGLPWFGVAPTGRSKRSHPSGLSSISGSVFCLVSCRLGWAFIIGYQSAVYCADPADILVSLFFRARISPEGCIQESANYGFPLFHKLRIIVHGPVPLVPATP